MRATVDRTADGEDADGFTLVVGKRKEKAHAAAITSNNDRTKTSELENESSPSTREEC